MDLQKLKADVEDGSLSRAKLAEMYGCSESNIRKLIKKHGWKDPRKRAGANGANDDLIDATAAKKFEEIKAELGDQITKSDEMLLSALSNQFSRYVRLEREVMKEGEVVISAKGSPYLNPKYNALQSAAKTLTTLGKEFGLSIASRKRVGIQPETRKEDNEGIFAIAASLNDMDIDV